LIHSKLPGIKGFLAKIANFQVKLKLVHFKMAPDLPNQRWVV